MSLQVSYGGRKQCKVPFSPTTLLVQVRDEACLQFNLDSLNFTLSYNKKALDLTLPVRLANLTSNSRIDLVSVQYKPENSARVKIRLPSGDFVGTYSVSTQISDISRDANAGAYKLMLSQVEVDQSKTLAQLGVQESVVFAAAKAATASAQPSAPKPSERVIAPRKEQKPPSATDARQAIVQLPGSTDFSRLAPPGDGPSEDQFRTYYNHIRDQAAPKAMVSKSTKARLDQTNRSKIEQFTIRVRLPNDYSIQGVFSAQETGAQVYDFVRTYLTNGVPPFTLETVSPAKVLEPSANLLVDTDFNSRVLLVLKFQSKFSGSLLNQKATDLISEKSKIAKEPQPEKKAEKEPKSSSSSSKTPKWLKHITRRK